MILHASMQPVDRYVCVYMYIYNYIHPYASMCCLCPTLLRLTSRINPPIPPTRGRGQQHRRPRYLILMINTYMYMCI